MEVELNTSNLRNLCRICLGEGDYNLWEHKVNWNCYNEDDPNTEGEAVAEGITLHEVLQMFNDWQHSILENDGEMQLICKECLSELQPHYRYYKRLCTVNKQIKQLYEEALQQEANETALLQTNKTIIEQVEYDNNLQECVDYIELSHPAGQFEVVEQYADDIEKSSVPAISNKQAQKRKFAKTPKFILTGGVTQLLTHATGATALDLPADSTQVLYTQMLCSPNKRKRNEEVMEMPVMVEEVDNSHNNLLSEYNTLVINKRRATIEYMNSCQPDDQAALVTTVAEVPLDLPPNELLKTDCATNEQLQEHITTSDKEEKQSEIQTEDVNDELAALPFSTLSADDAGRSIYVCKYCPQAFTAPCFLLTHARKSHVCKYCSKAFIKTPDLFAHVKESHTNYKCSICGKELSSNGNLRAHVKRMHGLTTSGSLPHTINSHEITDINTEEYGDGPGQGIFLEDRSHQILAEYLD
ncbi:unnamed protein product [Ceratitis capitata]|uniref:(Mediterranean fruit fly) hypothetical protein n=1 Tax=Ceratitis capitata TaxID=7213 RepID=A0A811UJ29_CERCA|nr:unnamed protein product [Ceratitis capitata]